MPDYYDDEEFDFDDVPAVTRLMRKKSHEERRFGPRRASRPGDDDDDYDDFDDDDDYDDDDYDDYDDDEFDEYSGIRVDD